MLRVDGIPAATTVHGPSAITVGVFDGVHRGHRALIARVLQRAREIGGVPIAITFREHPDALLRGRAPLPLQTLERRLRALAKLGIETTVVLDFTPELRDLDAAGFAERILRRGLGCERLVLGFDSAICSKREGTVERFRELGISAERVDKVVIDGVAASSSAIRSALEIGDVAQAAAMLGRPHAICGKVVRGRRRGHELGFPTANFTPPAVCLPAPGVYAAIAEVGGRRHLCVANYGTRPTVDAGPERWIEAHLLDFDADLYGQRLELAFVERLRAEQRFPSLDALKTQIDHDIATARRLLPELDPLPKAT